MLRQRQICSRQRYGGRGKINKTINTISIGAGTYYIKVSKIGKNTNGVYSIDYL